MSDDPVREQQGLDNRGHNCTGPGCAGCYAVYSAPRFGRTQLSEYEQRIQDRWERGER